MDMCLQRFFKGLSIIAFFLLALFTTRSLSAETTIQITNKINPIQIGATILDNGGRKGAPSINIWPPGTVGTGHKVNPGASWTYNKTVANESSTTFDVQINANRLSGQCDRLCGHVKVKISQDGTTCIISQGRGRCGSNGGVPKWTLSGQRNVRVNRGICRVTLNQIHIISRIVCSCRGGRYPCVTQVTCVPGTCPALPPYRW